MSNGIQFGGAVMILVGILIMMNSLDQPLISFYQVLILGAMFFGLGIVVCSVGILNNSIKKQTELFINKIENDLKKEVNSEGYEKLD